MKQLSEEIKDNEVSTAMPKRNLTIDTSQNQEMPDPPPRSEQANGEPHTETAPISSQPPIDPEPRVIVKEVKVIEYRDAPLPQAPSIEQVKEQINSSLIHDEEQE